MTYVQDESCIAGHLGERAARTAEEEDEAAAEKLLSADALAGMYASPLNGASHQKGGQKPCCKLSRANLFMICMHIMRTVPTQLHSVCTWR
jgi:hypothetical protein